MKTIIEYRPQCYVESLVVRVKTEREATGMGFYLYSIIDVIIRKGVLQKVECVNERGRLNGT